MNVNDDVWRTPSEEKANFEIGHIAKKTHVAYIFDFSCTNLLFYLQINEYDYVVYVEIFHPGYKWVCGNNQ